MLLKLASDPVCPTHAGDYLKYAGVPELTFTTLAAVVDLQTRTAGGTARGAHVYATSTTLAGKVSQRVEVGPGRHRSKCPSTHS
jgi:hypothetical protein